ncbi:hypothetical protein HYPSUDRAFT_38159 [Hypholoma sublateritium FD-334 SS-4]|uniref:Uncharacterized protein n=1 Tax=Hypholoma sublateritium (strain FD-334 SS-4) TaxID=945553 RepID=A0A0D2P2T1_HYPSF|nr:hypothetical protein HYPSUDRAFT_38159 [Hypholoma sublateritium FD-334 SS-4]
MPGLTLPNLTNITNITSLIQSTTGLYLSVSLRIGREKWEEKSLFARLPPELLREILIFAVYWPSYHPGADRKQPTIRSDLGSPFPLSQVCRQWRDIIIHTSSLWTDIDIYLPTVNHFYRTELWLERAIPKNLNIVVRHHPDSTLARLEVMERLFQILAKHRRRWRSINVTCPIPPPTLISALGDIQRLPYGVAQLREAHIDIQMPEPIGDIVVATPQAGKIYTHLAAVKGLRRLTWRSSVLPHTRFGRQLRFLELSGPIAAPDLLRGVIHCPALVYLSVHDVYPEGRFTAQNIDTSRVELPALVVLILTFVPQQPRSALADILPHLRLPALTQLQLQHIHPAPTSGSTPSDRAVVHALLAASRCRLASLNIDIPGAPPDELRAWITLPGAGELETLCLAGGTADDSVLADLTWAPEAGAAGTRLPRLRQLGLAVCAADVDDGALLRMIGSRLWVPVGGDGERRARAELRTAHVWVRECTPRMADYERMVRQCAERISAWRVPGEARELQFTEV